MTMVLIEQMVNWLNKAIRKRKEILDQVKVMPFTVVDQVPQGPKKDDMSSRHIC